MDAVHEGNSVEDSRVELKGDWIEPHKAARRLAGHANSARGEPILWIIGLDEQVGVVDLDHDDLAEWVPQVEAYFDGISPSLTELVVPTENGPVLALAFETDRAPFVTKNPVFGQPGGGPVAWEVPWREGTAVRSATRAELIRLLAPLEAFPDITVLGASVTIQEREPVEPMYARGQPEVVLSEHIRWGFGLSCT